MNACTCDPHANQPRAFALASGAGNCHQRRILYSCARGRKAAGRFCLIHPDTYLPPLRLTVLRRLSRGMMRLQKSALASGTGNWHQRRRINSCARSRKVPGLFHICRQAILPRHAAEFAPVPRLTMRPAYGSQCTATANMERSVPAATQSHSRRHRLAKVPTAAQCAPSEKPKIPCHSVGVARVTACRTLGAGLSNSGAASPHHPPLRGSR